MNTETAIFHKGLTLQQINDKFNQDYDLDRANKYLVGYRRSDEVYDVREGGGSILIGYPNAPWSIAITSADLIDKTPCTRCGGDGYDPDQTTSYCTPDPIACTKCLGSGREHNPYDDRNLP